MLVSALSRVPEDRYPRAAVVDLSVQGGGSSSLSVPAVGWVNCRLTDSCCGLDSHQEVLSSRNTYDHVLNVWMNGTKAVAFSRTTLACINLLPQSLFSELVVGEVGILGEGYIDMKTAEDHILDFVQVLADHPQEVTIKRINGNPVVFEVTVSQKDFIEVASKHKAVNAIAGCVSGLPQNQFVVKILER